MNNDSPLSTLRTRAHQLGLWGVLANWDKFAGQPWLAELLDEEETERNKRSLERRIRSAKLGRFKPIVDFDWNWPKKLDQGLINELLELDFVSEPANVVLVGPNGVGKTMLAKNLLHHAILHGFSARAISASELLNDLAAQESSSALLRRLRYYCQPQILLIDELGYLASTNEHADLLFEVVTRRYQQKPIIITTNKPFAEWNSVFPNAACVTTLVDRLVHKAEIINIDGDSFRLKEARERAAKKKQARSRNKTTKGKSTHTAGS